MSDETSIAPNGPTGEFSVTDFIKEAAPQEGSPSKTPEQEVTIQGPQESQEPPTNVPKPKLSRSLEGLDPKIAPLFRQMSNEAYNTLYPKFLEYLKLQEQLTEKDKLLSELKDSQWWQAEDAWILHPDYKALSNVAQNLAYEQKFWEKQLVNIESDQPWSELYKDPQTGEYSVGPELAPSPEARAKVLAQLNKATVYSQEVSRRLSDLSSSFKDKYASFNSNLQALDKELFGALDMKKWGPRVQEWLERFPSLVHNRIEYQMLAKAATIIEGLVQALRQQDGQKKIQSLTQKTALSGGPGQSKATEGSSESTDKVWQNFQRLTGAQF